MISLEHVTLLETKVARAIDYVERVTEENAVLQEKLDSYQKRIGELEVLVQRFKEDQGRIEDGILSALDRLNQFEDAIEKSLAARGGANLPAETPPAEDLPVETAAPEPPPPETETAGEDSDGEDEENAETSTGSGELDIF